MTDVMDVMVASKRPSPPGGEAAASAVVARQGGTSSMGGVVQGGSGAAKAAVVQGGTSSVEAGAAVMHHKAAVMHHQVGCGLRCKRTYACMRQSGLLPVSRQGPRGAAVQVPEPSSTVKVTHWRKQDGDQMKALACWRHTSPRSELSSTVHTANGATAVPR